MSPQKPTAKRDELRETRARGIIPHEALNPARKSTFSDVALEWFGKHVEPVRTAGHAQMARGALALKRPQHFPALTRTEDIKKLLLGMTAYQGSLVVRCALTPNFRSGKNRVTSPLTKCPLLQVPPRTKNGRREKNLDTPSCRSSSGITLFFTSWMQRRNICMWLCILGEAQTCLAFSP